MIDRFVFTISPGRSGQATLSSLLTQAVPQAFVAFEEPQVRLKASGFLGDLERRFRRRFVETHELLGRGRVLSAFDAGDTSSLRNFAAKRLAWVRKQSTLRGKSIYIDVSKHFLHGLHRPTLEMIEQPIQFIRLVRDPIENMRSYLNRGKRYALDYGRIDGPNNELTLDPEMLLPGEEYLHAWAETYLRGQRLIEMFELPPAVQIETSALSDPTRVETLLSALDLPHQAVPAMPPLNTNVEAGHPATTVTAEDIEIFERFRDRLTDQQLRRLPLLAGYDPRRVMSSSAAQL